MEKILKIIDKLISVSVFLGVIYVITKLFTASELSEKAFCDNVFLPAVVVYVLLVIRVNVMYKKDEIESVLHR
ncbi:hypothetical protein FA592_03590 [Sulfurospirillum diekertiae]|uniref:Uncharacterized protein n=1 Tax=Sulfurospirillum diekertiae TaxID=1854492 RepID=A0A6G9VR65_9BACT|nr:hypothetical protein [Sulfurospirillum diekertiae]QIR75358.1 hypothetical protein FA584_03685 [Sulfurospirillum diekertiae]QIR78007.1 hypothetical protein FA592_03590 [Sulfurospirillum diekertiae]